MQLTTDRLVIRSLQAEDAERLADIWSDADVTRYMDGSRNHAEVNRNVLAEAEEGDRDPSDSLWPVIEKLNGRLVGHCGILKKEVDGKTERELVYVFARDTWAKGYATEAARALCQYAFDKLHLKCIIALIDPENVASAGVAKKAGLTFRGETVRPSGKRKHVYMKELVGRGS